MVKQLVFIDDSGDPGFVSGVSSTNLLMAGALFIDPETATCLNEEIANFRKKLGWQDNHEFKFRKAPKDIKIRFLELVNSYDFDITLFMSTKLATRILFILLIVKNFITGRQKNYLRLCHWTKRM